MKTKLLSITSTFPKWDGDTSPPFVYELNKRLADNFEIHTLAPYSKGSKKYEFKENMYIHRFNYWPFKTKLADGAIMPSIKKNKLLALQIPIFLFLEFLNILRLIRKEKIEVIHAHWIIPHGLLAVIYKKLFNKKIKIVTTSHGGDVFGLKKLSSLKRWVANNCDYLTVVSNAIREEFLKIGFINLDKVRVIPMGVDLSKFSPANLDDSIKKKYGINGHFILFVGRLSEKKGVKYLVGAMPDIVKEHKDCKLLIVGDGEEREEIRKQISSLNMQDNIIMAGAIKNSDLPAYYATADIFVGPSIIAKDGDREGFGLVFVEAIGSGCITIATDLPAISDIIEDKKNGFIVPQEDSSEISRMCNILLHDNNLSVSIREYGLKTIRSKFDWKMISNNYVKILTR